MDLRLYSTVRSVVMNHSCGESSMMACLASEEIL
jgi:hypothetical protein